MLQIRGSYKMTYCMNICYGYKYWTKKWKSPIITIIVEAVCASPQKYIRHITKLYYVFHACHREKQNLFIQITKIPVSTLGPAKMEVLKSRHRIPSIVTRSHFCFSSIRVLFNCQTKGILPKPINVWKKYWHVTI